MNELTIPPPPCWYNTAIFACAPDNTLVYASKYTLVIIQKKEGNDASDVQFINNAHHPQIASVSLNKKWGCPRRYVASMDEDAVIKVWDIDTHQAKYTNESPFELHAKDMVVGAVFAGDDRIVSVSCSGCVNVWNITLNESKPLKLFAHKMKITCISSCPHAPWLLAFGETTGNIVIADMRRNGHIIFNMRGHFQEIVSLSWCPAPVNVFPVSGRSSITRRRSEKTTAKPESLDNSVVEPEDGTSGAPPTTAQIQNVPTLMDFLKECEIVKRKILGETSSRNDFESNDTSSVEDKAESIIEKQETETLSDIEDDEDRDQTNFGRDIPSHYDPSSDFADNIEDIGSSPEKSEEERQEKYDSPEKTKPVDPKSPGGDSGIVDAGETPVKSGKSQEILAKALEADQAEENAIEAGQAPELAVEAQEAPEKAEEALEKAVEAEETSQKVKGKLVQAEVASGKVQEASVKVVEAKDTSEKVKGAPEKEVEAEEASQKAEEAEDASEKAEEASENPVEVVEASAKPVETSEKSDEPVVEAEEPPAIVDETPRFEYLLASSSRDSKISIWRAGTDGRLQTFFTVPTKHKRSGRGFDKMDNWTVVYWIEPQTILTAHKNEILAWAMPRPVDAKQQHRSVHHEHNDRSCIFTLAAPPHYTTKANWRETRTTNVWSFGRDRLLINYDLTQKTVVNIYACIASRITCLDQSALDPNRLVLGLRDGQVKLWDLGKAHTNKIMMNSHHAKMIVKLSAVAWHPSEETVLAVGMEDGRVVLEDSKTWKPTKLKQLFNTCVYALQWGPYHNEMRLFALAAGQLVVYDTKKCDKDPVYPDQFKNLHIHKFAWKPDHSQLLLSTVDGALVLMDKHLHTLATLCLCVKGSNCIAWHPDACTEDGPRAKWFAVTTPKGFLVYNCDLKAKCDNHMEKIVAVCEAHLKPTSSLAWNPFDGDQIVSAAPDGLAHVWNVIDKQLIATYKSPCWTIEPQVSWSPLHTDYVIFCDDTVHVWKVSAHPPKNDKAFMQEHAKALKLEGKNGNSSKAATSVAAKTTKKDDPKGKHPRNCIVPYISAPNDFDFDVQINNMKKLLNKDVATGDGLDPLQIFGTQSDVTRLLNSNREAHANENKYQYADLISLWSGDISETIRGAIAENRVTPLIISLAPMVSISLWREACELYAKSLAENATADPLQSATYFLAIHKVEEAINSLCLNEMHREALALAKARLPENSATITEVINKWAKYLVDKGNFETAAQCYISMGCYEDAAKVLARRNNREFLEFASELAQKTGNKELNEAIQFKLRQLAAVTSTSDAQPNAEVEEQVLENEPDSTLKTESPEKEDVQEEKPVEVSNEADFTVLNVEAEEPKF